MSPPGEIQIKHHMSIENLTEHKGKKKIGYRVLYGFNRFCFHRGLYTGITISDYAKKCYSCADLIATGSRSC